MLTWGALKYCCGKDKQQDKQQELKIREWEPAVPQKPAERSMVVMKVNPKQGRATLDRNISFLCSSYLLVYTAVHESRSLWGGQSSYSTLMLAVSNRSHTHTHTHTHPPNILVRHWTRRLLLGLPYVSTASDKHWAKSSVYAVMLWLLSGLE